MALTHGQSDVHSQNVSVSSSTQPIYSVVTSHKTKSLGSFVASVSTLLQAEISVKKWWQVGQQFIKAAIAIAPLSERLPCSTTIELVSVANSSSPDDVVQNADDEAILVQLCKLEHLNNLSRELLAYQTQQIDRSDHLHSILQTLLNQLHNHQHTIDELHQQIDRLSGFQPIDSNGKMQRQPSNFQISDANDNSLEMIQHCIQDAVDEAIELTTIAATLHHGHHQQCHSLVSQQQLLWVAKNDLTAIQMPSLETQNLLVCKSQDILYALPLDAIEQVIFAPEQFVMTDQAVLQWQRGQEVVPVFVQTLSSLLCDSEAVGLSLSSPSASAYIAILKTETGWMGLQVDQVLSQQELVIHPLGDAIAPPPYAYGCCLTNDKQLALVINVRVLLQQLDLWKAGLR